MAPPPTLPPSPCHLGRGPAPRPPTPTHFPSSGLWILPHGRGGMWGVQNLHSPKIGFSRVPVRMGRGTGRGQALELGRQRGGGGVQMSWSYWYSLWRTTRCRLACSPSAPNLAGCPGLLAPDTRRPQGREDSRYGAAAGERLGRPSLGWIRGGCLQTEVGESADSPGQVPSKATAPPAGTTPRGWGGWARAPSIGLGSGLGWDRGK